MGAAEHSTDTVPPDKKRRKMKEIEGGVMGCRGEDTDMRGSGCAGEGRGEDSLHRGKQRGGDSDVYTELWKACASPLVFVPRVGEKVYYFPQGHVEQVEASTNQGPGPPTPTYDLPWKILCRVVNVQLKAEQSTDEVFAQLALLPEKEGTDAEKADLHSLNPSAKFASFSKILTASDTSTHGGFSVLKRHADECLPALDMSQRPPRQDLVAKDLHDVEWCFRHVFRGQPKRHLLTTGWSTFVSSKKLVAGDAFIFIRGESGELRIGVRRAMRHRNIGSASVMSSQSMKIGLLAAASHAISTGTIFTVYYWPRRSPSEFIVPYDHYMEPIVNGHMIGMRFHMRFENEDGLEERSSGTIIGIEDADQERWPKSKWRCLRVQWDESSALDRPEQVSPWKIELLVASSACTLLSTQPKRLRSMNLPFRTQPLASGRNDDSLRNNKVLQGQDAAASVLRFNNKTTEQEKTHKIVPWIRKHQLYPDGEKRPMADCQAQVGSQNWSNQPCHEPASHWTLHLSNISSPTEHRIMDADQGVTWGPAFPLCSDFHGFNRQKRLADKPVGGMCKVFGVNLVGNWKSPMCAPEEPWSSTEMILATASNPAICDCDQLPGPFKGLSGSSGSESLTGQSRRSRAVATRTGIKVHKQGTALGRSIDLSKCDGYEPLVLKLDRMFDFEGSLADHSKGWRIIYMDKDQDPIRTGDYPWKEFCSMVKKIFIYRCEEVGQLKPGS